MSASDKAIKHSVRVHKELRAIADAAAHRDAVPAPLLYEVLAELQQAAHTLAPALGQLGAGLAQSLEEYDVRDTAGDPADSVTRARAHLSTAAAHARQLGTALDAAQQAIAQQAIAQQGYARAQPPPIPPARPGPGGAQSGW